MVGVLALDVSQAAINPGIFQLEWTFELR